MHRSRGSRSKGAALDKVRSDFFVQNFRYAYLLAMQCKKEAMTDGVKRSLRNFGNLLGNCLYDKQYAQEIVKMKVPPVSTLELTFSILY